MANTYVCTVRVKVFWVDEDGTERVEKVVIDYESHQNNARLGIYEAEQHALKVAKSQSPAGALCSVAGIKWLAPDGQHYELEYAYSGGIR